MATDTTVAERPAAAFFADPRAADLFLGETVSEPRPG